MSDETERPENNNESLGDPIGELSEFRVDPHPDLKGRVSRDINRRTLAADSLDFSLNVMLQTFWEHLRSLLDAWPDKTTDDDHSSTREK